MTTLGRRQLLRGVAASTGLAWPDWMARAFGHQDPETRDGPRLVREAWERAKRSGRPLLLLVVPEDHGERWTRMSIWGEALTHGSDELLVDLGLTEVHCATLATARAELSPAYELPEESPARPAEVPLAVLVETDAYAWTAFEPPTTEVQPFWLDNEATVVRAVEARIVEVERLIRRTLAPARAAIEDRAERVRTSYDALRAERGLEEPPERAEARALVLDRLAAERAGEDRPARIEGLAQRVAARLRKAPPAGARWARSNSCGYDFEDSERSNRYHGCGMGYSPEISKRFLYFVTR